MDNRQSLVKDFGNTHKLTNNENQEIEYHSLGLNKKTKGQDYNSTVILRIIEVNSEAEVWKRKFKEINHDYSETKEKLMNTEIELQALRNQKIVTSSSTITKSVMKNLDSTVRQSDSGIKPHF